MIVRKPGSFGGMDCIDFHIEELLGPSLPQLPGANSGMRINPSIMPK